MMLKHEKLPVCSRAPLSGILRLTGAEYSQTAAPPPSLQLLLKQRRPRLFGSVCDWRCFTAMKGNKWPESVYLASISYSPPPPQGLHIISQQKQAAVENQKKLTHCSSNYPDCRNKSCMFLSTISECKYEWDINLYIHPDETYSSWDLSPSGGTF